MPLMRGIITALTLVIAGASVGAMSPVAAATHSVNGSCRGGLVVNVSLPVPADGETNHIRVNINSQDVVNTDFGTSFHGTYSFPQNGLISDWYVTAGVYDPNHPYRHAVYEFGITEPCGDDDSPSHSSTPEVVTPKVAAPAVAPIVKDARSSSASPSTVTATPKSEPKQSKIEYDSGARVNMVAKDCGTIEQCTAQPGPVIPDSQLHSRTPLLLTIFGGLLGFVFLAAVWKKWLSRRVHSESGDLA